MPFSGSPTWVLVFGAFVVVAVAVLVLGIAWELLRPKAKARARLGESTVELWVRRRRFPVGSDAVVVPVAPNLKMAVGVSKWVRDATASRAQWAADRAAPLPPGSAFLAPGGRYRFGAAALAVVMDEFKRTTPEWIAAGIARAVELARADGAANVVIADMTDDLLRQPPWITDQQRLSTCRPVAQAMMDGIRRSEGIVDTIRVWVWNPANEPVWRDAFDRLSASSRDDRSEPAAASA